MQPPERNAPHVIADGDSSRQEQVVRVQNGAAGAVTSHLSPPATGDSGALGAFFAALRKEPEAATTPHTASDSASDSAPYFAPDITPDAGAAVSSTAYGGRLTGDGLPGPVLWRDTVSSVLDTAHASGLPVWGSVIAAAQTAGRGQMRRTWYSPAGNIYAAFRLPNGRRQHGSENPFDGTAAAPLAGALLVQALRDLGLDVCLKWPNDVVLLTPASGAGAPQPRKVGGILLEERAGALWAGIGLNLTWAPKDAQLRAEHALAAAALCDYFPSVLQSVIKSIPPVCTTGEALWCWLVTRVHFCYASQLSEIGAWRRFVQQHLLWRGQRVRLVCDAEQHTGILQGIGPSGGVCLAHGGREEEFLCGSLYAVMEHNNT